MGNFDKLRIEALKIKTKTIKTLTSVCVGLTVLTR